MEKLANLAPLLGAVVAVIVLAFVIARLWRSRAPQVPARGPEPVPPEADDDVVDSSHIGFAPLVGSAGNDIHLGAGPPAGSDGSRDGRR